MPDTEVKPDEKAADAGEKKTDAAKPADGKKGGFFQKYKVWLLGGGAVVLAIFWLMSRNSSGSTATPASTAQNNGINPATGYLYGSPADIAALGGSGSVAATPGPQGNTGATGAKGPAGPPGRSGPPGNGLFKLSFAQAQQLAGKKGSSNLYYTSGGKIVQGKFANDKKVAYYTSPQTAVQKGYL